MFTLTLIDWWCYYEAGLCNANLSHSYWDILSFADYMSHSFNFYPNYFLRTYNSRWKLQLRLLKSFNLIWSHFTALTTRIIRMLVTVLATLWDWAFRWTQFTTIAMYYYEGERKRKKTTLQARWADTISCWLNSRLTGKQTKCK